MRPKTPRKSVLLDLAPQEQKTRPDFVATQALLGIDAVAPGDLVREGRRLWRDKNGKRTPVRRIFHRVVFDELEAKKTPLPFAYTDDLDVTFCPHPNWYWIWSKYSLLHLDHPAVPRTTLLSKVVELPADLRAWMGAEAALLFRGIGRQRGPQSGHDVARIPASERHLVASAGEGRLRARADDPRWRWRGSGSPGDVLAAQKGRDRASPRLQPD